MNFLPPSLVAIFGLACGAAVGFVFGFALTSHADVLRGIRPNTKNRLVLFLARPTSEMGLLSSVLFLAIMCAWLAVLFGPCALPAIASEHLSGDGPPLILLAYGCFALAAWLGRSFGAHAWRVMS
ncbi:hypothetical protein [Roseateles sp.]|uniref:hypothetical protein n=1 Tax=Roseateles sp. TaxID=1971397 RepID=UPI0025D79C7C|nr:hypothetical protein [Roseateles sp.]MBV8034943.1 hypothetical protein [Roseateles sp.]